MPKKSQFEVHGAGKPSLDFFAKKMFQLQLADEFGLSVTSDGSELGEVASKPTVMGAACCCSSIVINVGAGQEEKIDFEK